MKINYETTPEEHIAEVAAEVETAKLVVGSLDKIGALFEQFLVLQMAKEERRNAEREAREKVEEAKTSVKGATKQ